MSPLLRTAASAVALSLALGASPLLASDTQDRGAHHRAQSGTTVHHALERLERRHHSRLGVVAIDTGDGRTVSYRSRERFPFASTNKAFIAAAVLHSSSPADLAAVVRYSRADLVANAPITSRFVDTGMTVRELLDAMLRFSDNTAANLLVERLGGTGAVQSYLRGLGDRTTRVDRLEPELNQALPGDPRDTTTPAQFAKNLRHVVLGKRLESTRRALLRNAMLDNTTGDQSIRRGVPASWPVADKTGTGDRGVRNDIGVVYPLGRAPVVVVVMTEPDDPSAPADDPLVAAATRTAVSGLRRP